MRETGIARRALLDIESEQVVRFSSFAAGNERIALGLDPGPGEAQHGAFDPRPIHCVYAEVAEIPKSGQQLTANISVDAADRRQPIFLEAGDQKVLFQRYLLHGVVCGVGLLYQRMHLRG